MLNKLLYVFIWLSAAGFWLLTGLAVFRQTLAAMKRRGGANDKVRTHEQVVAVLSGSDRKKTIGG